MFSLALMLLMPVFEDREIPGSTAPKDKLPSLPAGKLGIAASMINCGLNYVWSGDFSGEDYGDVFASGTKRLLLTSDFSGSSCCP